MVGETRTTFTRDNTDFKFEGLVVENLDDAILAQDPLYGGKQRCRATCQERGAPWQWLYLHVRVQDPPSPLPTVRRAFVLRAPIPSKTVWPGEFLEVQLPDDAPPDSEYALEPHTDAPSLRKLKPSQL